LNVVIFGANKLGRSIADWLLNDWHEVSVIDNDELMLKDTEDELGSVAVKGNATHEEILRIAGTSRADIFIAASEQESDNMLSCQMAKEVFRVEHTICVIYSEENESLFQLLGIDSVINVTGVSLRSIQENLNVDVTLSLMDIPGPTPSKLISVRISDDSEIIGESLSNLDLPTGFSVKMIVRSGAVIDDSIESTILRADDQLVAITDSINLDRLKELFQ
jgi:trk system potassium uptake protein TrkA|tara:strand:- start:6089 stop:6748 length:660 start_codon:yes stop_codon:yes gene_type:complete